MKKKRYLLKDEAGHSTVLETLISVGISITLLTVFFYSANTLFTVQDTPENNLEAKTMGIMETMVTSTGQNASQSSEWQWDPENIVSLGLSTSPTVEYGIVTINQTNGDIIINESFRFEANEYGLEDTCFLAGTKVVMDDESHKNIEDIVIGDMVKCYDQIKREIVDSEVTHVFHHLPEEMGEYYLVINDQLRVTPNHLIYSDDGWIEASDLKIGDSLFYPSIESRANSIKKVFDRVPTFNIEVEKHHNYFVALGNEDTLVHNPTQQDFPDADAGGPYQNATNIEIQFDGTGSTPGDCSEDPNYIVSWDWEFGDGTIGSGETAPHTYTKPGLYEVNLTVTNDCGYQSIDDTATASISDHPIARFKWFDKDGLDTGTTVFFNAGESAGADLHYWWKIDDGNFVESQEYYVEKGPFNPGKAYLVTLKVNNSGSFDTVTHAVEVNTIGPEPDTKPWVLTGKDLWPDDTFSSHDEGYYITYKYLRSCTQGNTYLYEVKQKVSTIKPILDINKTKIFSSGIIPYKTVKSALGFDGGDVIFNFNIEVEIQGDPAHPDPLKFGASSDQENTIAKEATSRRVLIYYPPDERGEDTIKIHPEYRHGEITVRVFIGGTPPP